VHSDEALLATGFIFIFHFFHTHLRPETFPLDTGHLHRPSAAVPLSRRSARSEYQRLVAEGRLEGAMAEPPSEQEMAWARVFGFTAVGIGLLLAAASSSACSPVTDRRPRLGRESAL
jgi:hypothetical protein